MDKLNVIWKGLTYATDQISRIINPRYIVTLKTSDKRGNTVTRLIKPEQIEFDSETVWVELEDGSTVTVFNKSAYKELAESKNDPSLIVMNSINNHFEVYKSCQLYDAIGEWF